jgi:catechol 2,3-dioxygenase
MGVMRMGYMHVKVTDLAEAKNHYANTVGLYQTLEEGGRVYYKGWDEWDHHSIVIEEGGVGYVRCGFKCERPEDVADIERRATAQGYTVTRFAAGSRPEVGDGITVTLPSGQEIDLYSHMTAYGLEVGTHNPDAFPRHMVGIGAPRLDHALLWVPDVAESRAFFTDVIDMWATEEVRTSLDDDAHTIATWLTIGESNHDIALLEAPETKIHHFAFEMRGWSDILHSADIMAMDDVPIDIGPTRHGITRGTTIYFFDPAGNRNETFSGGFRCFRDRPMVIWTPDQLGKAIFYHARELNERFLTVAT